MRTLVDPENSSQHLLLRWPTYRFALIIIPDGVETKSGVSSSVYPLTALVMNYLALVLVEGGLTLWTEDGHSSLVGSVENSVCDCISYSRLPALHDLSSGSSL